MNDLKTLLDGWDYVVQKDSAAYGYEIYVRVADLLVKKDATSWIERHDLYERIVQRIEQSLPLDKKFFLEIWSKSRTHALG